MVLPTLVTLEGNIGAGKSTLLRALLALEHDDILVLQEPVDRWCAPSLPDGISMLQAFYEAPQGTALAFQMYVMLTRVQQLCAAAQEAQRLNKRVIVAERCSWSEYEIFGRPMRAAGLLSESEWFVYTAWFEAATAGGISSWVGGLRPKAVAYLRCSPDVCMVRVRERARQGERGVSSEYLSDLHDAHEDYMASTAAPVQQLILDGALEGEAAVEAAAQQLADFALRAEASSNVCLADPVSLMVDPDVDPIIL